MIRDANIQFTCIAPGACVAYVFASRFCEGFSQKNWCKKWLDLNPERGQPIGRRGYPSMIKCCASDFITSYQIPGARDGRS